MDIIANPCHNNKIIEEPWIEWYFLTCVSGQRANDRAGKVLKLWLSNKEALVRLSLLTNPFSHSGTWFELSPADKLLILVVVASSAVDILDAIPASVCVKLIELMRMSCSRIDVMVKYVVGLKVVLWRTYIDTPTDSNVGWAKADPTPRRQYRMADV